MALKSELDNLDGVPEPLKEHYVKGEGDNPKYTLVVDGLVPKARVDEFRANNINLSKERDDLQLKLKAFGDVTPENITEWKKTLDSIKDKKVLDDEGIEGLITNRMTKFKDEYDGVIKQKDKIITETTSRAEQMERMYQRKVISDAIREAALKNGALTSALVDIDLRGQQYWMLDEKGAMIMKVGGDIQYGKNGVTPMTPTEWVESLKDEAPHFFNASTGGGAPGNGGGAPGKSKIKSKSELKSPADKAKFIRDNGVDAYLGLPA